MVSQPQLSEKDRRQSVVLREAAPASNPDASHRPLAESCQTRATSRKASCHSWGSWVLFFSLNEVGMWGWMADTSVETGVIPAVSLVCACLYVYICMHTCENHACTHI